ncbi:MAG: hypothetical protein ACRDXX_07295 [Stackebrandtia sp.]
MTISGEELGAELYLLRRAGRESLPEVAAIYAQSSRHVHNTSWQEEEAFDQGQTTEFEDIEDSPVEEGAFEASVDDAEVLGATYSNWRALRDQLQYYMADTATSLVSAGAALEGIADAFAATDAAAAAELDRQSQGLGEGPVVPGVKYPGDPHDTETEETEILPDVDVGPFDVDLPDLSVKVERPIEEPTNPLNS